MTPADFPQFDPDGRSPMEHLSEREILLLMYERQSVGNKRLDGLHQSMKEIEGRMDIRMSECEDRMSDRVSTLASTVTVNGGRISNLETWRNYLTGAWAVLCVGGVVAGKWLWSRVTSHQ